ncbi:MAG: hypothetical protein ACLGHS_03770 [Actinomycetes bacterium]
MSTTLSDGRAVAGDGETSGPAVGAVGLDDGVGDSEGTARPLADSAGGGLVSEPEHPDISSSTASAAARMACVLRPLTRPA